MLLELMEDADRGVRYDACSALKGMRVSQAVPALIAALDEWDRKVRSEVVGALGRLGDREAVPALLSVVRDTRGMSFRSVGYALTSLEGDQAWEGIVEAAAMGYMSQGPGIARSLGESGYVRAMPRLRGLLDVDTGVECRCAAMALKGLGDTVTGPEMLEELGSDVPWRRARAARSLGALGGPESVEPLIAALGDDRDCVREAAAFALGEMDDNRAVGPLPGAASDESEGVRRRAHSSLEKLGTERRPVDAFSYPLPESAVREHPSLSGSGPMGNCGNSPLPVGRQHASGVPGADTH